ncbi:Probable transcriptional regulatory protein YebC [hydrothermal vent metagenome]|uniref:Probable transcriptional regulatory protein YebC n=1 Tax=hydrothermal vent metagenome TaxID=652676 RepID=A0A3B1DA47_9ZZZZ
MAGHSKWASIKHKKKLVDAKRGKAFTKIIKEITVAARLGGGDPGSNPRLRTAIANAKAANMPGDNMERAIKKGAGSLPGVSYEEITYEGYGVGGVAVMLEVTTDNRNRTVAEIRTIFQKAGGQLGENGCVSWMFDKKGLITIAAESIGEEELMEIALEAGAEDLNSSGDIYEVHAPPETLEDVRSALETKGIKMDSAEVSLIPQNTVKMETVDAARKMHRLIDSLEDHDDVLNVFANFDIPDEIVEKLEA